LRVNFLPGFVQPGIFAPSVEGELSAFFNATSYEVALDSKGIDGFPARDYQGSDCPDRPQL
jgi:hypothetical protein